MRSAAFSIKVFGVYVAVIGFGLLLVPNAVLPVLGFAETTESWVRVLGALALVLGFYYWTLGAANVRPFFAASLLGRSAFCLACVALVIDGAPAMLLVIGAVDVAGAGWTYMAMRGEPAPGESTAG